MSNSIIGNSLLLFAAIRISVEFTSSYKICCFSVDNRKKVLHWSEKRNFFKLNWNYFPTGSVSSVDIRCTGLTPDLTSRSSNFSDSLSQKKFALKIHNLLRYMWKFVFSVFFDLKLSIGFTYQTMTTCLGNVSHTLVLIFAARKMESVASFFIHDDDDGPSIAHIAVNCSTRGIL